MTLQALVDAITPEEFLDDEMIARFIATVDKKGNVDASVQAIEEMGFRVVWRLGEPPSVCFETTERNADLARTTIDVLTSVREETDDDSDAVYSEPSN